MNDVMRQAITHDYLDDECPCYRCIEAEHGSEDRALLERIDEAMAED